MLIPFGLLAQRTVRIISSERSESRKEWGVDRIYHPVFLHEGSTLSADSADYNPSDRFFDAFGNVVITQPDGTVVYADKLHYIKDTRIAILTNNVRMVDKSSVLTTNHLTYNMESKIGTYVNGGRITNGTDTLTSKNGYYFENTKDSYFRYDVIVRTPDTKIFTDTLRYNSNSKMAYFYGPTNIQGQSGNLYTENGDYHTDSDVARFGKNNLYTEGSKFLKGDSLFYDGKAGFGRAVKNVVFIDTAQQILMYSQLGVYRKEDESTTMTQQAYMVFVTENDTASTDRVETPTTSIEDAAVDTLETDSLYRPRQKSNADSVYMSADTLYSRVIFLKDYDPIVLDLHRDGGDLDDEEEAADVPFSDEFDDPLPEEEAFPEPDTLMQAARPDSLAGDSINTSLLDTALSAAALMEKAPPDSLKKPFDPSVISKTYIAEAAQRARKLTNDPLVKAGRAIISKELEADSLLRQETIMPVAGQADSSLTVAHLALSGLKTDSVDAISDTARTRIVMAYHNMQIFKSDLQAVADSAYYGYADSIIRCYGDPMIWSQGSQLSSDTLYMQLKNQKMDNMLLKSRAFIVSTQLDSSKFNQVKGRKITGFFHDNKLDRMFVDGNAESIYYTMDQDVITGMTRSIGSRIKIVFDNNEVSDIINIRKTETSYSPMAAVAADKEILPGFIWKPKDRPASKEEVVTSSRRRQKQVETAADDLQQPNMPKPLPVAEEPEPEEPEDHN